GGCMGSVVSMEVLDQHEIVHFLIDPRNKQSAAVRREGHIGIIPYRFFVQRQERSNLPRRKTPEADNLTPFLLGYEIDPLFDNTPRPEDPLEGFQLRYWLLRAALDRHSPNRAPPMVREINQLAVGRRKGLRPPGLRKLSGLAAPGWNPPDLI